MRKGYNCWGFRPPVALSALSLPGAQRVLSAAPASAAENATTAGTAVKWGLCWAEAEG